MKQCKACPWLKSTNPERDIPNGYSAEMHAALRCTIAREGEFDPNLRVMACHESPIGRERKCVGWLANQLGPGNNIALRLSFIDNRAQIVLRGEQHDNFEDTLPKRRRET